MDMMVCCYRQL